MADFAARNPTIKAEHQRLPNNCELHEQLVHRPGRRGAAGRDHAVARERCPAFAAKGALTALDAFIARDKLRPRRCYYENELPLESVPGARP